MSKKAHVAVPQDLSKTYSFKLANRISALGSLHRDTVTSLAERADLSPSTIYRFLWAGVRAYNPTLNTLVKLSGAFKMPLSTFVDTSPTARAALTR